MFYSLTGSDNVGDLIPEYTEEDIKWSDDVIVSGVRKLNFWDSREYSLKFRTDELADIITSITYYGPHEIIVVTTLTPKHHDILIFTLGDKTFNGFMKNGGTESLCIIDDNLLCAGSRKKVIQFWSILDRKKKHEIKGHHKSPVNNITLLNNNEIATVSDSTIQCFDLHKSKLCRSMKCHSEEGESVKSLSYDSKNNILYSTAGNEIRVWNMNLDPHEMKPSIIIRQETQLSTVDIVNETEIITTGYLENEASIQIWDVRNTSKPRTNTDLQDDLISMFKWIDKEKRIFATSSRSVEDPFVRSWRFESDDTVELIEEVKENYGNIVIEYIPKRGK